MSLFYKCDCCGQIIHKLGSSGKKRLHMDIGNQVDYDFEKKDQPCWDVSDIPLIQIDLCQSCYNSIVINILDIRETHGFARDLTEVSVDGKSI